MARLFLATLALLVVVLPLVLAAKQRALLDKQPFTSGQKFGAKDVLSIELPDASAEVAVLRVHNANVDEYFALNKKKHVAIHVERIPLPPGEYQVEAILSNPNEQFTLGSIVVEYNLTKEESTKISESEERLWEKRPEFLHQPKPEPPRAPAFIAFVVACGFAGPWLLLFAALAKVGVSVNVMELLKSSVFALVVAGQLAVMVLYWLGLPIGYALALIVSLAVVAILVRPRDSAKKEHAE